LGRATLLSGPSYKLLIYLVFSKRDLMKVISMSRASLS